MRDPSLKQDLMTCAIGCGGVALKFADIVTFTQQLGAFLGSVIVIYTCLSRIYVEIKKFLRKKKK